MEPEKRVLPGVFSLIKQSLVLYKNNYGVLVLIGLVPVAISLLFSLLSSPTSTVMMIVSFVLLIITILIQFISQISLLKTVSEVDNGSTISLKESYAKGFRLFFPYIWVSILSMLTITIPYFLFIIPGIILAIYLSQALPALVVDNYRGLSSLSVSFYYVKDNWWKVVWRYLALGLIFLAIFVAIGLFAFVFGQADATTIIKYAHYTQLYPDSRNMLEVLGSSLFGIITYCIFVPIMTSYTYFLYKHLKLSKPTPNPEIDFKKSRSWFKGLSIAGFVVLCFLVFVLLVLAVLGIASSIQ